jgi:isocitrate lyase
VSDGFQVTVIGMKKVADAKRRDFLLMAHNSEVEAENLRREGNVERAKKFLAQEAKWRAMAARSDEEIYREYKASQ